MRKDVAGKKKQLAATQQYTAGLHQEPLKYRWDVGMSLARRTLSCQKVEKRRRAAFLDSEVAS